MSFRRYSSYKDSGVEWWGDMPEEWGLFPAKRSFARKKELNSGMKCDNRLSLTLGGVVPRDLNDLDGLQASEFETYQIFCADDLVFKLIDLQNIKTSRVGLVPETGIMSPAYIRVEPNKDKVIAKFAYWFFTNLYNRCIFNELGGGVRQTISSEELLLLPFPSFPREEQTVIATFLDRETSKIDRLVAEQRRLMELLKEKLRAIISHAVTRGLNPVAPLKPSGTIWFEEIPHHWTSGPLKHFWKVIDCKHVTVPFLDEGIPVASIMEVRSFNLDLSQAEKTSEEAFNLMSEGDRQPRLGDVIYCRNTANTGTSAYVAVDERIALGQDVCLIKSSGKNGRYLNYVLHSSFMASELETLMVGSTFKRINVAQIRGLIVPCPPLEEQNSIATYLDDISTKFDTLTSAAQRAIDLLQERRTALISAAVTGQIDVRHHERKEFVP